VAAPEAPTERDDLSVLRADDGPVVIETSEDALLPEPLPGAGTSFEGELDDLAAVDGRTSDPADATDELGSHGFDPDAEVAHGIEFGEPDPPVTHFDDGLDQADSADQAGSEPFGAADDFFGEAGSESASTEETDADPLVSTPSTDADGGSGDEGDDPDRGALLDFLSSVKP
jgi:hypothetical protein